MQLSENEARRRLTDARVIRLATADADGVPHLVPATFAVHADSIAIAVDAKPKRHQRLKRLDNVAVNPRVCLLADRYDDDWAQLWWVRADGLATVHESGEQMAVGYAALRQKYTQYERVALDGPVVTVAVTHWSSWHA